MSIDYLKIPGFSSLTRKEQEEYLSMLGVPQEDDTQEEKIPGIEEKISEIRESSGRRRDIRGKPYKLFGWG